MSTRLVNLFVKNVSAVEKPANKRSFLVIKSAVQKEEGNAITFDDAMFGNRVHKVYMALGERYGALMETIDSIRSSRDEDKPVAVKAALSSFLDSLTKAVPSMLSELDEKYDVEKGALDPAPFVKLRGRLDAVIKEMHIMPEEKKVPDATSLSKIGNTIAAMFGKAMGADEKVVADLEKASIGEKTPTVPIEVSVRLTKAETENTELKVRLEKAEAMTTELREQAELRKFAEEVSGFKDIGLDPTKDAALLKSVSEKLPKEQAERFREILKAAAAQAAASNLLKEVGSSGTGIHATSGSAMAEIETKVSAKLVELRKSSDKVTEEQARDSVFRENPGLYERWAKETSVKV